MLCPALGESRAIARTAAGCHSVVSMLTFRAQAAHLVILKRDVKILRRGYEHWPWPHYICEDRTTLHSVRRTS